MQRLFQISVLNLVVSVLLIFLFSFQEANCQPENEMTHQEKVPISVRLLADAKGIEPGKPFKLFVVFEIQPGWHIYYKNAGDAGMPTQVQWNLPKGFTATALDWQPPETFSDSGIVTYGYRNRTTISAMVTPPMDLTPGSSVNLTAKIKWLSCKNICLPGGTTVSLSLPIVSSSASSFSVLNTTFSDGAGSSSQKQSVLLYLLFAFIGGVILNFMPCVLPVIAIKLMSLLEESKGSLQQTRLLGATFSAGIVASFLSLAGVVIAMKAAGQQVGWGFQFQYPGFLIGMAVIVTLMALSMFGMFYMSVPAGQSSIDNLSQREGVVGTFFKGVLATTLSTPCTAPFLGAALGFGFAQPWWIVFSIFLAIGLGMSLPYLLLTAKPEWISYLPKPGVWMEKLKEAMGFLLLGTVVWLLYVLGSEVGAQGVVLTIGFLVAISFSAWILSRFTNLSSGRIRKVIVWSLVLIIGGLSYYMLISSQLDQFSTAAAITMPRHPQATGLQKNSGIGTSSIMANGTEESMDHGINWEPFDLYLLNRYLAQGRAVLLDFTADWCLTCKVNERTVLSSKPVIDKIRALNMVTMRADWTTQNPEITQLLNKFQRSGVPLYVILPAHHANEPIVLPEILTESILLDELDKSISNGANLKQLRSTGNIKASDDVFKSVRKFNLLRRTL